MNLLPHFDSLLFNIIFCSFLFFAFIQLFFVFFIQSRLAFFKNKEAVPTENLPPLSVIIAARNESDNLYDNLPMILEQDYPNFEVIIINNQSDDESAWLLAAFARQFPNLHVVEIHRNKHLRRGKKLAITLGIRAAKYEHIVLTDADCVPTSTHWLRHMATSFSREKQIVLGYGPFKKEKGFVNRLIRFDAAWIGVSYLSMALARLPYMGVGRNLAYTKSVFNEVRGFKSHYSIPSGDDDLFIQEAAKNRNYTIQIHPDSYCLSPAAESWTRWKYQKSRHYSTSGRYRFFKKLLLGMYPSSLLMWYICFVLTLFKLDFIIVSSVIFLLVFILKWWIQGRCLTRLNEKKFARYFPFWDVFYALIIPFLFYFSERQKLNRW